MRSTTADNGLAKKVLVNYREARTLAANFAEWDMVLSDLKPGEVKLRAHAGGVAGNVEKRPHVLRVVVPK